DLALGRRQALLDVALGEDADQAGEVVGAAGGEDLLLGAEAGRPLVGEREVGLAHGLEEPIDLVRLDRVAQAHLLALLERNEHLHVAPDEDDLEVLVRLAQDDAGGALLHDPGPLGRVDDVVTHLEGHSAVQSNTAPAPPAVAEMPSGRGLARRHGRAAGLLAGYRGDLDVLALEAGLDLADTVSYRGRALEVERLRGRPHLVLEERQLLPQVVEGQLALPRVELRRRALGLRLGLAADHLVDALAHGLGRDAVLLVVGELLRAPALRLGDRRGHRLRHLVGVQVDLTVDVARRPADRLDQRALAPEEAGLVG